MTEIWRLSSVPTSELSEEARTAQRVFVQSAWETAYQEIFTPTEIAGVFAGSIPLRLGWAGHRHRPLTTIVAESVGGLVGLARLGLLTDESVEVMQLYVRSDQRWHGIGTRLWGMAGVEARLRSADTLRIWTLARGPAVRFYVARGCTPVGESTLAVGDHIERTIEFEGLVGGGAS